MRALPTSAVFGWFVSPLVRSDVRVAFASVFFLLMSACAVGGRHAPDSKLEENFILNEAGFEALLAEVNADDKLEMLRVDEVRYAGRTFSIQSDFSGLEHLGLRVHAHAAEWPSEDKPRQVPNIRG